jgi:acetyl-CoA acetyltransferase
MPLESWGPSGQICVVGVGCTDYGSDYRPPGAPVDSYSYGARAFARALADSGHARDDIDGLIVGPTLSAQRTGEILGLNHLTWGDQGDAMSAIAKAVQAIWSGMATTVALVYGNDQRSSRVIYGGQGADGRRFLPYTYYAPWGLTSQGALYALMTQRYFELHGHSPEALAPVAIGQRAFASLNPRAVMRTALDDAAYRAAPYISQPLRLYDYCLVNDGGVSLILTSRDNVRSDDVVPVAIEAIARRDLSNEATTLRPRLIDFYHTGHRAVAERVYSISGIGPDDIKCVQIYDSFSCHVFFALEGFGFCPIGEAPIYVAAKGIGPGGQLAVNTSGGHLSESYMQGWNHQFEAIQQVRGVCGPRQIDEHEYVQYISDVGGEVISIIYRRCP